jgi:hypothetical protein
MRIAHQRVKRFSGREEHGQLNSSDEIMRPARKQGVQSMLVCAYARTQHVGPPCKEARHVDFADMLTLPAVAKLGNCVATI